MPCIDHPKRDGYDNCPYCEIARLRELLKPLARMAKHYDSYKDIFVFITCVQPGSGQPPEGITIQDCLDARAALEDE